MQQTAREVEESVLAKKRCEGVARKRCDIMRGISRMRRSNKQTKKEERQKVKKSSEERSEGHEDTHREMLKREMVKETEVEESRGQAIRTEVRTIDFHDSLACH